MEKRKRDSLDNGDPRTPMAWQHRDMNYQQAGVMPANSFRDRYPATGTTSSSGKLSSNRSAASRQTNSARPLLPTAMTRNGNPSPPFRSSSISPPKERRPSDETSTGTVSDTESEPQNRKEPGRPETRGTMRSIASVPLLAPIAPTPYGHMMYGPPATWDGEPCPVHGANSMPPAPNMPMYHPVPFAPTPYPPMYPHPGVMRRAASVHDFNLYGHGPYMAYPPTTPGGTRAPSVRGSVIMMPHKPPSLPPMPPANLLPPLQRPRQQQTEKQEQNAPPLPPKRPPPSAETKKQPQLISYKNCCQGNVLVLWSILAVIAFGIVLGVVLSYTVR